MAEAGALPDNPFEETEMNRFAALLPIVALFAATPALAHPKLVASTPQADATVASPQAISLSFSERLFQKMSGATLARTGMAGMAGHGAGPVPASAALSEDGKTMTVTPTSPLSAGTYRLDWFGVGGDTHRVTGSVSFAVR
jgi:methionine-rich copper-binding protein CopC